MDLNWNNYDITSKNKLGKGVIYRCDFSLADKTKKVFSHFSCHTVILIVYQCVMCDRKVVFLSHCRHKAMCV